MGDIVSIAIWQDRRDGYTPLSEEEEAIQRGLAAWRGSNYRKMKEADWPPEHPPTKPRPR